MSAIRLMTIFGTLLCLSLNLFSSATESERYKGLIAEKIRKIQITKQEIGTQQQTINLGDRNNIESVVNFVKSVKMTPVPENIRLKLAPWKFKMVFDGFREQIVYFESFCFFGKSIYRIDPKTVSRFSKLLESITSN